MLLPFFDGRQGVGHSDFLKVQNMWIIPELAFKPNFLAVSGKPHADYGYDELLTRLVFAEIEII